MFSAAAAILAAVEGGILPPGKNARFFRDPRIAGRLEELFRRAGCPGSTAGETPAATLNTYYATKVEHVASPKVRARSTSPINLELESRERIGDWNLEPGLLTKFVPTRRLAPAAVLV